MSTPVLEFAETETTPRRLTVDEYHEMAATGILGPDERVELIAGRLWNMAPIGGRHMGAVNLLSEQLTLNFAGKAVISTQSGVMLSDDTELYPDIALLKGTARAWARADRLPGPDDVLLVVEVAHSTLRHDREVKAPLYAAAGVPELWVINLAAEQIEVCRKPTGNKYSAVSRLGLDDEVSLLAFPDTQIAVSELLP